MNAKQNDVILEALSRRKFLRTSSATLVMSALAGATALRGQERPSTQAAEHDHSSSDPGQENKPLLDENGKMFIGDVGEGDLWLSQRDIRIRFRDS